MNNRTLAAELCKKGFTSGYAEVRRLVYAGAVKVNGKTAERWDMPVQPGDYIECGRRKRMVVEWVEAGKCRNEWEKFGKFRCSECGLQVDAISTNTTRPMPIRYCPNCGKEKQ